MPMSPSEICSKAMVLLGQNPIPDITNTANPNAVKCNAVYESEVEALLREYDWTFARGRVALSASAVPPAFGWGYQFQLPSDCAAVRFVNDNRFAWTKEGNMILTDMEAVNLIYTKYVTETGLFDALFIDCLSIRIARSLAYSIFMNTLYGPRAMF